MKWEDKIVAALKSGPKKTGDLIEALGFDCQSTYFDNLTRMTGVVKPLHDSFVDSPAQRALGRMVKKGAVGWQRASNLDNWYKLPGQRFPREAKRRTRTLKALVTEVLDLMHDWAIEEQIHIDIADNDCWVAFSPFVLSEHEDGWELADGDPICNWCGNTFEKVYPMDVPAEVIVRKIKRQIAIYKKEGRLAFQ